MGGKPSAQRGHLKAVAISKAASPPQLESAASRYWPAKNFFNFNLLTACGRPCRHSDPKPREKPPPVEELMQTSPSHAKSAVKLKIAQGPHIGEEVPTEAREQRGVDTSTRITTPQEEQQALTGIEGTGGDDAKTKVGNGLEVLGAAEKVKVESLLATSCVAARDVSLTINHNYYLPLPPEAGFRAPSERISTAHLEVCTPPISKPSRVCPQCGAALAELKAHHTNSNSPIGKAFGDPSERMEPPKSAIHQPPHSEQPVIDSTTDRHNTLEGTSGATRLFRLGTAGATSGTGI
ncbi:hypothetical protein FA13DRAFT_1821636 [Coprinellus micaceus]|uniref:Uncharacterized protein n=1 Tax=Coprinellus micaceus TaxID=71717 RepID=A0A4Y7SB36_COPMI|nr:hypothetical protein FA13DRAFT_1821636 [Coprinellus micaceus]